MSKLLCHTYKSMTTSPSPIQYKYAGYNQRYLAMNDQEIACTGIDCETCLFFVERSGAIISNPNRISKKLNQGVNELSPDFLLELEAIIPSGSYSVLLLKIYPRVKRQWDAEEYYKAGSRVVDAWRKIEEYIVPIQKNEALDSAAVEHYIHDIQMGITPTALSVSFLDCKHPTHDLHVDETWLFTHFLLDGHHKMYAAALAKKPITMVSFLSIDHSFSTKNQREKLLETWR